MTNETTVTKRAIETKVCGRCGGTGTFSYCSMYGTMCFGCSGRKVKLTKRGAAANAFLIRLRSRRVSELRVGMLLYIEAGPFNKGGFKRINKISSELVFSGVSHKDNVTGEYIKNYGYAIECAGGKLDDQVYSLNEQPDAIKRIGHTAFGKAETLRIALDFQDKLTKSGTVRKGVEFESAEEILATANTPAWEVAE